MQPNLERQRMAKHSLANKNGEFNLVPCHFSIDG